MLLGWQAEKSHSLALLSPQLGRKERRAWHLKLERQYFLEKDSALLFSRMKVRLSLQSKGLPDFSRLLIRNCLRRSQQWCLTKQKLQGFWKDRSAAPYSARGLVLPTYWDFKLSIAVQEWAFVPAVWTSWAAILFCLFTQFKHSLLEEKGKRSNIGLSK